MPLLRREDYPKAIGVVGMIAIWLVGEKVLTGVLGKDFAHNISMGLGMGFLVFFQRSDDHPVSPNPIGTCFILFPLAFIGMQALSDHFFGDSWIPVLITFPVVIFVNFLDKHLLKKRIAQQSGPADALSGRR